MIVTIWIAEFTPLYPYKTLRWGNWMISITYAAKPVLALWLLISGAITNRTRRKAPRRSRKLQLSGNWMMAQIMPQIWGGAVVNNKPLVRLLRIPR
jgi:hypothetical protein